MNYFINGITRVTMEQLDECLTSNWRHYPIERSDGLVDIKLNDAWIEIKGGLVIIMDVDERAVVLFRNLYTEIVIS